MAIAYFTSNGYTVSMLLNDIQDYDWKNKKIETVQVKSTGCKTKYDVYRVALKSCGGTKGNTYKIVIDTNVEYLFILTTDIKMYFIPCDRISNIATLNLSNEYLKYEVKL